MLKKLKNTNWSVGWLQLLDVNLNCKSWPPMLPEFQFSIHSITWALLSPDVMRGLQWPDCTLSSVREGDSNEPTGDPVDSDPISYYDTEKFQVTPSPLGCHIMPLSRRSCPARVLLPYTKYWPFSPVLPVRVYLTSLRCGLSSTYHLTPLAQNESNSNRCRVVRC
jgi:hypothetical protein